MKSNIAIGIIKNSGGGNSGNAFGQFQSFSKGLNNCVINTETSLQPGDIVNKGWKDANTWWESAIYNGGDVTDMDNYTPIIEVVMDTVCAIGGGVGDSGQPGSPSVPHYSAAHYSSLHYST